MWYCLISFTFSAKQKQSNNYKKRHNYSPITYVFTLDFATSACALYLAELELFRHSLYVASFASQFEPLVKHIGREPQSEVPLEIEEKIPVKAEPKPPASLLKLNITL